MSRHVPRHRRWNRLNPSEYVGEGAVVRYHRGGWYAWVCYELRLAELPEGQAVEWRSHRDQLGPFKRPRNAMMAAEEQLLLLRRRNGEQLRVVPPGSIL